MEISRRTDYAVRMLLKLAGASGETISVRELAEVQGVPYSFARSIQRDLVKAGLVVTTRGAAGGTALAKSADDVTLYEVVNAIQGPVVCSTCTSDLEWCSRMSSCRVHGVWADVNKLVKARLEEARLSDLI